MAHTFVFPENYFQFFSNFFCCNFSAIACCFQQFFAFSPIIFNYLQLSLIFFIFLCSWSSFEASIMRNTNASTCNNQRTIILCGILCSYEWRSQFWDGYVKLNGANYLVWTWAMCRALDAKNMLRFYLHISLYNLLRSRDCTVVWFILFSWFIALWYANSLLIWSLFVTVYIDGMYPSD